MIKVRTYAIKTFSDTDKIIKDLKEQGCKIIATNTDIKHKAFTVVYEKEQIIFEEEAEEYQIRKHHQRLYGHKPVVMKELITTYKDGFKDGYNKAKEEMQEQDYSLVDFVMQYENGKFKCKYKSGKVFESVDGETWKEIILPKESE